MYHVSGMSHTFDEQNVGALPDNSMKHTIYMGWLRLVGSLKLQVCFAKEPYKRDNILQKRPMISRSLLIEATPYTYMYTNMYVYKHIPDISMKHDICIHICIRIYVLYIYICLYVYVYIHIYIIYIHVYTYMKCIICIHIYTYIHIYI